MTTTFVEDYDSENDNVILDGEVPEFKQRIEDLAQNIREIRTRSERIHDPYLGPISAKR